MTRKLLTAVLMCGCASLSIVEARGVSGSLAPKPAEVSNTLAKLPLSFEPNYGQSGCEVKFQSRAPGYLLQLTATEMRMIVRGSSRDPRRRNAPEEDAACRETEVSHALRFIWIGANPRAGTATEAVLPGTVNYLKGSDPAKWRTSIPTFERVRYQEMYPGIDLLYYGNGRQLEYDLIVAPGADPDVVRMSIEGAETVLTKSGDLDLVLSDGRTLQLRAPVIYQERGGEKRPIEGKYRLAHREGRSEIAFDIAAYDPALPLVIDPLLYSTFLGGSGGDYGYAIAVNAANEAFVTGYTPDAATGFPTTAGAFDTLHNGSWDVFVTRLNSTGSALVYSTFLGGIASDFGLGIAVNAASEAFVTGQTGDGVTDFPTTAGAFATTHNGGNDAFVTRLNAGGTAILYSTLLGGSSGDGGYGIAVNAANEAFVTGYTVDGWTDFPTTAGAFDTVHNGNYDAFVTRLNAGGTALVYSTFLGGSGYSEFGNGIAVNASDEAFVSGQTYDAATDFPTTAGAFDTLHNGALDAFVTRLNAGGTALVYSTFLGGSNDDRGYGIVVNDANEAFVTGDTNDGLVTDFPTTAGAFATTHNGINDAFVTRLNAGGTALVYSTFLGGSGNDVGSGIALNAANEAFVTGYTYDAATDFPTTAGAFDTIHNGTQDAFVTCLNAGGSALLYSTFLGGSGADQATGIGVNTANEAFVTGQTSDGVTDFPTTAGAFDTTHNGSSDVFVTRLTTGVITPTALAVDGNGVIEAGETAGLTPSWRNDSDVTLDIIGSLSSFTGPGSSIYTIVDGAGSYGSVAPGATAAAIDNCSLMVSVPATRPSVHWDASVVESPETTPIRGTSAKTWTLHIGNSFTDVATSYAFYREIETLLHNNVTLGCGDGTQYCKNDPTSRLAMAAFIARAELGSDAAVPESGMVGANSYNCTANGNSLYTDVAPTNTFCKHVHYIATQNITAGCTGTTYCPSQNVTRLQMAIFLARAIAGSDGAVPAAYSDPVTLRSYDLPNGVRAFTDLVGNTFEKHANYLWALGISNGCTGTTYCPSTLLTRGQMAKFLVGTYDLLLYKP